MDEWIDGETGVVVEDGLIIYDNIEKQAKIRCMDFEQKKSGILQFIESLDYKFHEIRVNKSEIPLRY